MKLIIIDVCNTLVNTNSTYSYIDFLMSKGIKKYYNFLFHNRLAQFLINGFSFVFRTNYQITLIKNFFKGLYVNDIEEISAEFFEWYKNQIEKNILEVINQEKNKSKVILLSSSINQPIDYLKKELGIEGFSSELEIKNGKYTGKVTPLRGMKEKIFKSNKFQLENYKSVEFFTDNTDDIGLINYLYSENSNLFVHIRAYKNQKYRTNYFKTNNIIHEYIN